MGDDKQYTIQVKGTAYRFKPIPPEEIERVNVILNMNASPTKTFRMLTRVMAASAGPEQWDELTDLLIEEKVALNEITGELFSKIVKRQIKERKTETADDAE